MALADIAEYLEHVREFASIAASEKNPRLKRALEREAAMYRRRAEVRAKQVGKPESSFVLDGKVTPSTSH